eukprot:8645903-Ditylum_brightwellii.AAC.1
MHNALWTPVTITSSCTRKEGSHEDDFVMHSQKHNGMWVMIADKLETKSDDESSIGSCSDSVPEPQVLAVKVTRQI